MFFVALVNNAIDIVSWIIYLECIITWVSGIVSSLESHCVHSTRTYKMTSMLGRGVTSGPEGCRAGDVLLLWRRWMWFKDYLFNIGFICICQQKGTERPERGGDGLWGLAWQRWRWQILTGEIWIPLMQEAHTQAHTQAHTHTSHLSNTNSSPSFTQGFLMHHSRDLQGWSCWGAQRRDVDSFFLHPPSAYKIEGE